MRTNGTRAGFVPLGENECVPVELRIGSESVQVFLDHGGIHFRQVGEPGRVTEGHLRWEDAIAMSLLPPEWRRDPG